MTSKDILPDSWASEGLEVIIRNSIKPWRYKKLKVTKRFQIGDIEAVKSDLEDITLPEIFASEICILTNRLDIRDISATLQAFQTYRVSLYDIRTDKHEYKLGKPTFFKLFGEAYVKSIENKYAEVIDFLAKELERLGIKEARKLARLQYDKTLEADRIRNSCPKKVPIIEKTIKINEDVAGNTARYIARLAGGNEDMEEITASLADSMSTLEDLIGILNKEDLSEIKATIPLAYLQEEIGLITKKMQPKNLVKNTRFVEETEKYVKQRLRTANNLLQQYNYHSKGILNQFIRDMNSFMISFPRDYFK